MCVELKTDLECDIGVILKVKPIDATRKLMHFTLEFVHYLPLYIADEDFNGTTPLKDYFYSGQVAGDRLYFNIYIFDDDHLEKNESFYVILYGDNVEVHIQKAVVNIIDDDGQSTCCLIMIVSYVAHFHLQLCMHLYRLEIHLEQFGKATELCWC